MQNFPNYGAVSSHDAHKEDTVTLELKIFLQWQYDPQTLEL
jgi:hypothetical protein